MPTPTIIHGFNNLPTPDLTIRETGYDMSNGNAQTDPAYGTYLAATPEDIQAVLNENPGLGWDTNAQYLYYKDPDGNAFSPEEPINTDIQITFPNMITDGTNDYTLSVYISITCIVPEGYTCNLIPIARVTADGHFELVGGRVVTNDQGVKHIAIQDFVEIGYNSEAEDYPTDLTFLVTLNDLDTGDKFAEANGETDTYGNNYHGAENFVWPYQESWGFLTGVEGMEACVPDKVYVSNNSWLTTGNIDATGTPDALTAFGNSHGADCDGDECSLVFLSTINEGYTDVAGGFTTSAGSLRLFSSLATPGVNYTIVASADDGGSISDEGSTTVEEGGCMTYTITPDEGYQVGQIIVDGQLVGYNMTEYSFCPVHADHTIHVTFIDDDIAPCSVEAPEIVTPPIDPLTAEEEFVDELPESGEANTVYYVTDGEGYDIYYWDGTKFVKIA